MKQKVIHNDSDVVTRGILREELQKELQNYPTNDQFEAYRSEMLTKLDQIVGMLDQMREEQLFVIHDIRGLKETDEDHEKRIKKLERQAQN